MAKPGEIFAIICIMSMGKRKEIYIKKIHLSPNTLVKHHVDTDDLLAFVSEWDV